jgi:membrane-bound ClpP family serine protease
MAEEDTSRMSLIIAVLLALFVLPSPWGVIVVIGAIGLEAVEIWWGLRLARGRSSVGVQALVGKRGRAATDLDPVGQVLIEGERWGARAARPVAVGTTIEVLSVNGLELEVAPVVAKPPAQTATP